MLCAAVSSVAYYRGTARFPAADRSNFVDKFPLPLPTELDYRQTPAGKRSSGNGTVLGLFPTGTQSFEGNSHSLESHDLLLQEDSVCFRIVAFTPDCYRS